MLNIMAVTDSLARIQWNDSTLGLTLVNALQGYRFFMYAVPFLSLTSGRSSITMVKRANRNPASARGYHAGEIVATMSDAADGAVAMILYFGPVSGALQCDSDAGTVTNAVDVQMYNLSKADIDTLRNAVMLMESQRHDFNAAMLEVDIESYRIH